MVSTLVSTVFFLTILAAALTSAISMLEVGVAFLTDERGMKRRTATLLLAFLCWGVGILCSLSFGPLAGVKLLGLSFFDFLDSLCSNWLLPLGGLVFCLFAGWKMSRADVRDEFTNGGTVNVRLFNGIYFLIRFVAPSASSSSSPRSSCSASAASPPRRPATVPPPLALIALNHSHLWILTPVKLPD